ncbi:MAG: helix-turn-helix domain-containing protein [Candidatus Acidiferrales bacterium]
MKIQGLTPLQKIAKMNEVRKRNKLSQPRPKCTNRKKLTPISHIPPPQRARIQKRYISGESIRKISREEKRHRVTVAKIVRAPEVAQYRKEMRERFYGIGYTAIDTVRRAAEFDAALAHKVLEATGVIPSPEELASETVNQQPETEQERRRKITLDLMGIALDRHEIFGTPIHELEEKLRIPISVPKKDKVH